jgi:hypothetical protein
LEQVERAVSMLAQEHAPEIKEILLLSLLFLQPVAVLAVEVLTLVTQELEDREVVAVMALQIPAVVALLIKVLAVAQELQAHNKQVAVAVALAK